jgi:hypothetical protein
MRTSDAAAMEKLEKPQKNPSIKTTKPTPQRDMGAPECPTESSNAANPRID